MHNISELFLDMISPLMMKRILVISEGKELHQASFFPTMKNTITNVNTRASLAEV